MENKLTKYVIFRLIILNFIMLLLLVGNILDNQYIRISIIAIFIITSLATIVNYLYSKEYYPLFSFLNANLKEIHNYEISIFNKGRHNKISTHIFLLFFLIIFLVKNPSILSLNYSSVVNINLPLVFIIVLLNVGEIIKLKKINNLK
ncbi:MULTISPECIES: hypothetical protein [Clostridium]|uniref:Uncharacterized protein n=1 Tax=Clostridium putrefaciens TaxID=99675 RepID=A0A381J820_9CLOT|nr:MULTISPECIES: hypothetical protein [Clostridium]MBU3208171.1 hypothetical protein [Clostridium algidicarnis]MBU3227598.1 hypothetical protein [Clostridium algidicarnis]MBU3250996.1 hypothetical protein [Clostridium algidicarnis]SUY46838.1 Uncharacterised protein [Clostridium putrefaciens]